MVRLRELGMGAHFAYNDVRQGLGHGALPAHWPSFMVERSRQMPEELLAHLRSTDGGKTGVFDTHPSDADRVRAAEAAAAEGVLVGADSRASHLFRDFDALSAAATRHHFEHDLASAWMTSRWWTPPSPFVKSENRRENFTASERFFGDGASVHRPLRLHVSEAEALETGALLARLAAARDAMADAANPASRYVEFNQLELKRQKAFAARALLAAGFASVSAEDFELTAGTVDAAATAENEAYAQQQTLTLVLGAFDFSAAERLSCALALLRSTGPSDESRNEVPSLVEALNALATAIPGCTRSCAVWTSRRSWWRPTLNRAPAASGWPPMRGSWTGGSWTAAKPCVAVWRPLPVRPGSRGVADDRRRARRDAARWPVRDGSGDSGPAAVLVLAGILGRLAAVGLQVEDSLEEPSSSSDRRL